MTVLAKKGLDLVEKITIKTTEMIGTVESVIVHTFLFVGIFALRWFGFDIDTIMLILTTAVSLEAIYLSIFIQMSVNRSNTGIEQITEEVGEIAEDVEGIDQDVDKIYKEMGDLAEDVEDIGDSVEDIGDSMMAATEAEKKHSIVAGQSSQSQLANSNEKSTTTDGKTAELLKILTRLEEDMAIVKKQLSEKKEKIIFDLR